MEPAVEYEIRTFHDNFPNDTTPYQDLPSPKVDQLWEDLYDSTYSTSHDLMLIFADNES